MPEREVLVGGRTILVRDDGAPDGDALMYFHGTPGSRLDVAFGDDDARASGVRVVSFDRPGYGGSDAAPFSLSSVAQDAGVIADALQLGRFATLGHSGGGPFALAAAAVLGERVSRVGVASGAGPFQQVPGALDQLDDNDRLAASYLPEQPERAAEQFGTGFEMLAELRDDEQALLAALDAWFGESDGPVIAGPARGPLAASLNEAARRGPSGGAWDDVAWIGEWDFDLDEVRCPVLLWYGDGDPFVTQADGKWLAEHLADATFEVRPGEGHLGFITHWREVLAALTR